ITGALAVSAGTLATSTSTFNANSTFALSSTGTFSSTSGTKTFTGAVTASGGSLTTTTGTQNFNNTLTASGATFNFGSSTVNVANTLSISAGAFTSTSGNLNLSAGLSVSGSPTFTHNSGTVRFLATQSITPSSIVFNNVTVQGTNATFTLVGTMIVNGTLVLGDNNTGSGTMSGGVISARGNVTVNNFGYRGTSEIQLNGTSGTQNVENTTSTFIPAFRVNTSGASVVMTGTFQFQNGFTYSAGTVNTSSSVFIFNATQTIFIASSVNFQDVQFGGTNQIYTLSGTSSFSTLGNLSLGDLGITGALNGNSINARGNVTFTGNGFKGTSTILINGNSNQTISSTAAAFIPPFQINSSGGVVTLTGTLKFNGNFTYTTGSVDASGSTLNFINTSTITSSAVPTWGNVTINGSGATFTLSGTFVVGGTLTLGDTGTGFINSGVIEAKGNVVVNNNGYGGTTTLNISGSTNQSLSGISSAFIPALQIVSSGGTVTFSGTLRMYANYTVTSGTIDASSSALLFERTSTITPGTVAYNTITFLSSSQTFTISGTFLVNGLLTMGDSGTGTLNGGTIVANGNVTYNNNGYVGTASMIFGGSTSSILSSSTTNILRGNVTVNKLSGASLTLGSNINFNGSGQTLEVVEGSILMSGWNLTVQSNLLLSPGTTVNRGGAVLTANGSTINAGTCCGGGNVL
ncbi:MAG: beta strand repeat-containing protein, partial [Pseudobdellovibrionaceae bacterium]